MEGDIMMRKQKKQLLFSCAFAAFTMGATLMSYAATGWQSSGGDWHYYLNDGEMVQSTWKKSGTHYFWLNEDGTMATDLLIEDGDDCFYVNESGAMVSNEWRELDNDDDSDGASDTCWYYLGANGKAYKAGSTGKTTFKSIQAADGATRKYVFDSEGRMLYGWVNEESERQTDEDAWKSGIYYLGEAGDGALRTLQWARLEVEDDENEVEDFDDTYWFYFGSNGKKYTDTQKTINGRKYRFEENGNAVFNWYSLASDSAASDSNMYYNLPTQCWRAEGWFYSVPDKDLDPEGYDDGEEYWFYAQKSGELVKSQIKKINGWYYGFNEYGEMLQGLYKLSVDNREIISYEEIVSESDMPDETDEWSVFYFGNAPKDGVMKTGAATVDIDGEEYKFQFRKSGSDVGMGYEGINDGSIYSKGRLLKADKDSRLAVVTFEDNEYLVNTAGAIQKKKTNAKDADDRYYCTDSAGIITYSGNEKWTRDK